VQPSSQVLDVRAGRILEVRGIPRANRLVELLGSLGDHVRGVVAGLKLEQPDPQEIVGR